jgi:hypothetical protein
MKYLPSSFPVEIPSSVVGLRQSTMAHGAHVWQSPFVPVPQRSIEPDHSPAVDTAIHVHPQHAEKQGSSGLRHSPDVLRFSANPDIEWGGDIEASYE